MGERPALTPEERDALRLRVGKARKARVEKEDRVLAEEVGVSSEVAALLDPDYTIADFERDLWTTTNRVRP